MAKMTRSEPVCCKCGSADIYTRWKQKGDRLENGICASFNYASKELLRRTCRGCGYAWSDDVLDSAGALEPDPAEKVERLEGFVYEHEYGLFSFNKTGESPFNKRVISKRKVREVLPGDRTAEGLKLRFVELHKNGLYSTAMLSLLLRAFRLEG